MMSRFVLGVSLAVLMLVVGPMTYYYLGTKTSKVAVPNGRKAHMYQNKKLSKKLAAGKRTMVKLTLSKKAKAAVLNALRRHMKVTVKIGGTATGVPGLRASAKLTFSGRR